MHFVLLTFRDKRFVTSQSLTLRSSPLIKILCSFGNIGNKYDDLDASQPGMSDSDLFEVNEVIVDDPIIIPAWSAKFVKIPFKCTLGDWKTFEARPYDNVLTSNTVFNAKMDF